MPDAYEVRDGQYITTLGAQSAADALYVGVGAVPQGRVRTILTAYASCSVAETQTYWFSIGAFSLSFPITMPTSRTITPAVAQYLPMLLEGMEIKLFQGENLFVYRAAATAGSTISIVTRHIEIDQEFYVELDRYKVLRRRAESIAESQPGFLRRRGFGRSSAFTRDRRDRDIGREG